MKSCLWLFLPCLGVRLGLNVLCLKYGDGLQLWNMNLSYSNVINVLKSMVLQTCHVKYVFNMCYMRVLGKSFKVCLSVFRCYIIVFNSCHYMFMGDVAGVKYNINSVYGLSLWCCRCVMVPFLCMVLQVCHGALFLCVFYILSLVWFTY